MIFKEKTTFFQQFLLHKALSMLVAQHIAISPLHKVVPASFHILRSAFLPNL